MFKLPSLFFKRKNRTRTIIIFLVLGITIYNSDNIMVRGVDKLNTVTQSAFKLSSKRNTLLKFFQNLNPTKFRFFQGDTLQVIDVVFTAKNQTYIDNVIRRATNSSNIYQPGSFISNQDNAFNDSSLCLVRFKGVNYKGHIKLQGQWKSNFMYEKKCYAIKLINDSLSRQILPFKKVALITIEDHSIPNIFSNWLSAKYLNFSVNSKLIRLKFNGENKGLYYYEEKPSKELLSMNGFNKTDMIKPIDEWTSQYIFSPHNNPFIYEKGHTRLKNYSGISENQISNYQFIMTTASYGEILEWVDVNYCAKFEALRFLTMDYHDIEGDNLKMLYKTEENKFYPYFRMEQYFVPLISSPEAYTYDQALSMRCINGEVVSGNTFFKKLNQNKEFRLLRNQYLHEIWSNRKSVVQAYDSIYSSYEKVISTDYTNRLPIRVQLLYLQDNREILIDNIEKIGKYLNYSRVYTEINISGKSVKIKIKPDANVDLRIVHLEISDLEQNDQIEIILPNGVKYQVLISQMDSVLKSVPMSLSLDSLLSVELKTYQFEIITETKDKDLKVSIDFLNQTTNRRIDSKNSYSIVK